MTPEDYRARIDFSNAVLGDWDEAMDKFFRAVEKRRVADGLRRIQTAYALKEGYGTTVADNWLEWSEDL